MGRIEVIAGGMFSGKTEELIRRIRRAKLGQRTVAMFKPAVDNRYSDSHVVSHMGEQWESIVVSSERDIQSEASVIGIDEAQFFGKDLPRVCRDLANQGKRVIVAGLDMDWEGNPFGVIPELMAIAEGVTKLLAVCSSCGEPAGFSHRKTPSTNEVEIGGAESYVAMCRGCYNQHTQNPG